MNDDWILRSIAKTTGISKRPAAASLHEEARLNAHLPGGDSLSMTQAQIDDLPVVWQGRKKGDVYTWDVYSDGSALLEPNTTPIVSAQQQAINDRYNQDMDRWVDTNSRWGNDVRHQRGATNQCTQGVRRRVASCLRPGAQERLVQDARREAHRGVRRPCQLQGAHGQAEGEAHMTIFPKGWLSRWRQWTSPGVTRVTSTGSVRVDPKQLVQTPEAQRHIAAIKDMAALSNIQSLADAPELIGDEHRTYTKAEVDQLRRAWALKYRNEPLP